MPTYIYSRDNPGGKQVAAPPAQGTIIYERDADGVVRTLEDGVPVVAKQVAIPPVVSLPKEKLPKP